MTNEEKSALKEKSRQIRYMAMDAIGRVGIGHVGGCTSIAEALVVLYTRHMRINPRDPKVELSAEVINVHTIKPIDAETVLASVRKTGAAVTCENHNILSARS